MAHPCLSLLISRVNLIAKETSVFGSALLIDNIVKNLKLNMRFLDKKALDLAHCLWLKAEVIIYFFDMNKLEQRLC